LSDVNRGFGATAGFGIEATWGTPVARTNWMPVVSAGLRRTRNRQDSPNLGYLGQASTMPRNFYLENDFAGGPITTEVAFDDSSVLLARHIFGTNVDSGGGPFTHTMTLSSPLPTGLTIEQISGTPASGGGNVAEVFEGCLINSARYYVEHGKRMMVDLDIIAETSQGLVASGTPTYNTAREFITHNMMGTLTLGGTSCAVKSLAITISRNLERNGELGSLFTQRPVENRLQVEIDANVLWQQSTWDTNYLADTQGALAVTFTGTSSRTLVIAGQNVAVWDVGRAVSSAAGIQQSIKLRPFADANGTNQGLSFAFTNANAVHTTN
jgi:hypothetical protein